jgi:serine/threonine protein kinase
MKKIDIWALGVTIYSMAFNKLPFDDGTTTIDYMEMIS